MVPSPWNWLNGNVDPKRIKYDLKEMKDKGMGGTGIWDVAAKRNAAMAPGGAKKNGPMIN